MRFALMLLSILVMLASAAGLANGGASNDYVSLGATNLVYLTEATHDWVRVLLPEGGP